MKIENTKNNGHWVIEFEDGLSGVAMYDKTLDQVIKTIARVERVIKSIEWVED